MMTFRNFFALAMMVVLAMACQSSSTPPPTIPEVYNRFYGLTIVSKTVEGEFLVIVTKGMPDHKSPYYSNASGNYTPYDGDNINFAPKPAVIAEQHMTFKIPLNPKAASAHAQTQAGPIGLAANGVPFYNQWIDATQGIDLIPGEENTIDQFNGHTQSTGQYHYHQEPMYLTESLGIGKEQLLGFMLDGFPIYGPRENGGTITNGMLDGFHGHTSVTQDYANGIYHYHVTAESPYLVGPGGYYGTPGTVTQ